MKIDLTDRTAIVSGSTEGIGFAIARGLAQSGASVVVNGRTPSAVEHAVAAIRGDAKMAEVRGVATAEEVANMVVYVVSAQASATTGAALRVDGGIVETIA